MSWELFTNPPSFPNFERMAQQDSLDMQNYIEARGWYFEGGNRWAKATAYALFSAEIEDAYDICLRDELELEQYDA